jgi:protein-arginine kinase activator protein McsA
MLRKKFNFNNLFSEFDSLFEDFGSFSSPYLIRGKKNVESGNDENGSWTKESFVSEDGSFQVTTIYKTSSETNKSSSETLDLKKQLESAVEKQDYESAAELRDKIKSIESNKEKIKGLESKLNDSVKNQDFESAIKYRDEIKKLKS